MDELDIEADALLRRMRISDGIGRSRFRSIVRRMVRKGLARVYFVDGKACVRLTPEGKEWLDAQ